MLKKIFYFIRSDPYCFHGSDSSFLTGGIKIRFTYQGSDQKKVFAEGGSSSGSTTLGSTTLIPSSYLTLSGPRFFRYRKDRGGVDSTPPSILLKIGG